MRARLFGLLVLWAATATASAPVTSHPATRVRQLVVAQASTQPLRISQAVLQMTDTVRAQMLAMLARGDIQKAIALYQLETGRQTLPRWLQLLELAFTAENRRPGPCLEVARRIFTAFQQLGGKPEFIRFTPHGSRYLAFEMRAGEPRSTVQLSDLGLHVAVRLQNKIYDAFTGPQGLPEDEYIRRLVTEEGMKISSAVLNSLDEP
ncbi:MAG TPA: hypothetical protein VFZ09_33660 [Archangium sp.]|uniref:hypothetical protein n=1 Tax=Archangium sp. TaxID=1872627 RepID=UPI002E2FB0C2|nr:hypothetical protein [Archangium sp.]HEX5751219.1 hypothetical protein [Archangium sp.]